MPWIFRKEANQQYLSYTLFPCYCQLKRVIPFNQPDSGSKTKAKLIDMSGFMDGQEWGSEFTLRSLWSLTPLHSRYRSGHITRGYLAHFVALVRPNLLRFASQTSDTRQPLSEIHLETFGRFFSTPQFLDVITNAI